MMGGRWMGPAARLRPPQAGPTGREVWGEGNQQPAPPPPISGCQGAEMRIKGFPFFTVPAGIGGADLTKNEFKAFLALAEYAGSSTTAFPSRPTLGLAMGVSLTSVRQALAGLTRKKFLTTRHSPGGVATRELHGPGLISLWNGSRAGNQPQVGPETSPGGRAGNQPPEVDHREVDQVSRKDSREAPASPLALLAQYFPTQDTLVRFIFEAWKEALALNGVQLTPGRREKILTRLKDSRLEEILGAIAACAESAFHRGANDGGKRYTDLAKHILRSREKVEWWNDRAPRPPSPRTSPPPHKAVLPPADLLPPEQARAAIKTLLEGFNPKRVL